MPPKGKKGKRGKKVELRVARPEPVDGDDREIAMLWEKIGAVGPNPFAPVAHHNMYVTASAAVPSGPLSGAIAMPTAPPGVTGSWGSAALAQQQQEASEVAASPPPSKRPAKGAQPDKDAGSPGGSPGERHHSSPASAAMSAKPTILDQKVPGTALNARVAPASNPHAVPMGVLAPRHTGQSGRAAHDMVAEESAFLKAQAAQEVARDEERALIEAIAEETRQFAQASETLSAQICDLEGEREKQHATHKTELTAQESRFETSRFGIEGELEKLTEERPEVEALLAQKQKTRDAIADAKAQLTQMAIDHVTNVKELHTSLSTKKQRLESTMTTKLRRTVEELASLTADQHAARRERAEQERERLTAELAAAEQQSRSLAARSRRLTNSTDMLRRDVALEAERRAFLSAKNASLAGKLQKLVGELEGLERRFVQQSPRDSGNAADARKAHRVAPMKEDGSELANIVDQQYEIILQLRRDLVALRREVAQAAGQLASTQQAMMQPDASATGALVVLGAGPAHESDVDGEAAYNALVRRTIIDAVQDMERGFVNAGRRLEDVTANERRSLVDYLVKRVNNAVMGVRGAAHTNGPDSRTAALVPRPPRQLAATV